MAGPLTGLSVIELAGLGPCPLAGQLLADLGASVTVIDRESRPTDVTDINRRGKRSIALNLKTDAGIDLAKRLIDEADVLLEGFRPGVMERLGLGPDEAMKSNPALVYTRLTGWGQTGPESMNAGHDINYLSITGALAAIGTESSGPIPPLNLAADYAGGSLFAVFGVMTALYERQHSQQGQVIDAAMVDGVPAMMGLLHQWFAKGDWSTQMESNLLDGAAPFYRTYKTCDDRYMALGALEHQFFKRFIELMKLPEQLLNEQYDKSCWAQHRILIGDAFAKNSQSYWVSLFEGSDACVTPVLTLDEAAAFPHNAERQTFQTLDGVLQANPAPRFSRSEVDAIRSPSAMGADTEAILKELGVDSAEWEALKDNGVLS